MDHKFFSENRRRLLAKTNAKLIVISANYLLQKSGDSTFPFKQDPNFWYLCGISEPDVVLVISEQEEYLIMPQVDEIIQLFDGAVDLSEVTKISGIEQLLDVRGGWKKLKSQLESTNKVATLLPGSSIVKFYGFYAQPARRLLTNKLKRLKPGVQLEDLRQILAGMRMVKQPVEIAAITKAIKITNDTLSDVLAAKRLTDFDYAYQLEAAITDGFRSRGASGHGFEPIVASGKNATIIHYPDNSQKLNKGELVIIDVGSEYHSYTADIARTVSFGQTNPRQIEIFEAVKQVQQQAFGLIKPGVMFRDYEQQVEKLVGEQLIKLGVIKSLDRKAIRHYYPHACSHSLGIDPHDAADYSQPMPVNMVMAVEPGIYIPEESIGVRIEDDVLITADGCRILSSSLPTSLII